MTDLEARVREALCAPCGICVKFLGASRRPAKMKLRECDHLVPRVAAAFEVAPTAAVGAMLRALRGEP